MVTWLQALVLPLLGLMTFGQYMFFKIPAAVGIGPHSISTRFAKDDVSYGNELNNSLLAVFWIASVFTSTTSGFLVEQYGLGTTALYAAIGVTVSAVLFWVAVDIRSVPLLAIAQIFVGVFSSLQGNTFLGYITRWFGSGATMVFAVGFAMQRAGGATAFFLLPRISAHSSLMDALLLCVLVMGVGGFAAHLLMSVTQVALLRGEISVERKKRREVMSVRAFALIPAAGWLLALSMALHWSTSFVVGNTLKNAIQSHFSVSSSDAGAATGVYQGMQCLGGLLAGAIHTRWYCPRLVMTGALTVSIVAAFACFNSTAFSASFSSAVLGLTIGAFLVTITPAMANITPAYPMVICSVAGGLVGIITACQLLITGRILDDFPLPPCDEAGSNAPPPGGEYTTTAAPVHATTTLGPRTCSEGNLAEATGYVIVINLLVATYVASWLCLIAAIAVDRYSGQRVAKRTPADTSRHVVERDVELDDVLVRRSTILGPNYSMGYGATD
jgi:MFS family permease